MSRVPAAKQWDSKSLKHILDCFALKQMEDTQIENLRLFLKNKGRTQFQFAADWYLSHFLTLEDSKIAALPGGLGYVNCL